MSASEVSETGGGGVCVSHCVTHRAQMPITTEIRLPCILYGFAALRHSPTLITIIKPPLLLNGERSPRSPLTASQTPQPYCNYQSVFIVFLSNAWII